METLCKNFAQGPEYVIGSKLPVQSHELDPECQILVMKQAIERRAKEAGMDFDWEDIVAAKDFDLTVVFLLRTREPIHDESEEQVGWHYTPLIWAEYFVGADRSPQVAVRCPWLVLIKDETGHVTDGRFEDVEKPLSKLAQMSYIPRRPYWMGTNDLG